MVLRHKKKLPPSENWKGDIVLFKMKKSEKWKGKTFVTSRGKVLQRTGKIRLNMKLTKASGMQGFMFQ